MTNKILSLYPSIFYSRLIQFRVTGGRQGTSWTGHQSITETNKKNNHQHCQDFMFLTNLEHSFHISTGFQTPLDKVFVQVTVKAVQELDKRATVVDYNVCFSSFQRDMKS